MSFTDLLHPVTDQKKGADVREKKRKKERGWKRKRGKRKGQGGNSLLKPRSATDYINAKHVITKNHRFCPYRLTFDVVVVVWIRYLVRWYQTPGPGPLYDWGWYPELRRTTATGPPCVHWQSRAAPGTTVDGGRVGRGWTPPPLLAQRRREHFRQRHFRWRHHVGGRLRHVLDYNAASLRRLGSDTGFAPILSHQHRPIHNIQGLINNYSESVYYIYFVHNLYISKVHVFYDHIWSCCELINLVNIIYTLPVASRQGKELLP